MTDPDYDPIWMAGFAQEITHLGGDGDARVASVLDRSSRSTLLRYRREFVTQLAACTSDSGLDLDDEAVWLRRYIGFIDERLHRPVVDQES